MLGSDSATSYVTLDTSHNLFRLQFLHLQDGGGLHGVVMQIKLRLMQSAWHMDFK